MPTLFSPGKQIVKSIQLSDDSNDEMSIANCSCHYQIKTLDNFAIDILKNNNATFEERCVLASPHYAIVFLFFSPSYAFIV